MAGVVPTRKSASGRKQWTIHTNDVQKSFLKRLRSQLASDGCAESQVVLAKQLLDEECKVDTDSVENAKLGVYWLMKASEQGNIEATELLRKCWETGKGITEQNFLDVKSCIHMTQDEKLARKAAKEMFANLSNGEDFITSSQLQKEMLTISKKPKNKKCLLNNQENNHYRHQGQLLNDGDEIRASKSDEEEEDSSVDWNVYPEEEIEKITEDHLVTAAVNYSNGYLPLVNRTLCLNDPNLKVLDHIPFLYRSILHPFLAFRILYCRLLRFLGQQPLFRNFPIAKSDLQVLVLLLVYCFISSENSFSVIPVLIYYITFIVLTITTCQMIQSKKEFLDFRIWSGLFICYSGGDLNGEQAEYQYIRNNLKPYGHFFLALLLNIIVYPIILELWLPQSEITILAFCLTLITLFGFMSRRRSKIVPDYLALFSFAVNLLAKYPYETDTVVMQGWRFVDLKTSTYLPTVVSYVIGNGIEFCINFRMLLYAFIPFLLVRIASRDNWRGTYKDLIPHCVTLSWLQIVIINSQGATTYGLLRGTLALFGFVLFIPLAGLTTVLLPAAAITNWLIENNLVYSISIFVVFSFLGLNMTWLLARSKFRNVSSIIQIVVAAIALYCLLAPSQEKSLSHSLYIEDDIPKTISWEQYEELCYPNTKLHKTSANIQMNCMKLEDMTVQWDGYVTNVRIQSVKNKWKDLYEYLPRDLREYFYCLHGEKIENHCDSNTEMPKDLCETYFEVIKATNKCSLDKYNVYETEITVKMQHGLWDKGYQITIDAEDNFKSFTLYLQQEDHIWFMGTLKSNYISKDSEAPLMRIVLKEIRCVSCAHNELTEFKLNVIESFDSVKVISDIYLCLKCVLNFLLNPVFVFK